ANRMFCLVRTSTEGKPQDGISFVLIDSMDSPSLTVKPIVTLAGDHEVNQVFFDNVRTPVANRIGPENAGWTVAKYLLEFERGVESLGWYAAPFEPEARLLGHNQPTVTPDYGITAAPLYLNNRASTIYAGSNEIQRNIIAKAVLGL